MNDLLKRTIIYSSINLQFLDYIDEMFSKKDLTTVSSVNKFFKNKKIILI